MDENAKLIKQARPRLRLVSPLPFVICWIYVVLNIFIGLGMFFLYHTSISLVVANVFSYQVWGVLFFTTGILSAYFLINNNWQLIRGLMIIGITMKSIWAIALIIRCIDAPQTILITVVWLGFLAVQAATYMYFFPKTIVQKEEIT